MFFMDKRTGRKVVRTRKQDQNLANAKMSDYQLADAIGFFIRVKKANNLKVRTLEDYEKTLRYFEEWMNENYGQFSVNDITIRVLREYVLWCANEKKYYDGHPYKSEAYEQKRGISPSSVNVRIRVLKSLFSTLFTEGVIEDNPAQKLSLLRIEQDTVQPLTEEEIRRLLKAPDQRYYAQFRDYCILVLMLDTGMRINEICSLEQKDVDLMSGRVVLPASKNKNRKARVLPLSGKTVKLLMQLIRETKSHFDTGHIFVTYYGETVNEKTIQKSLTRYAEIARIDKRVSPHVLRHNFAKMAALNGMDVFSLMRILGHADISTTRRYVQVDDEDVKKQHDRFSPVNHILMRK